MNKRWYDMHPTVSMAVSLLHNARPGHRDMTITYINEQIEKRYPQVWKQFQSRTDNFWTLKIIQKRTSMDERSWTAIEGLRLLPDEDREALAVEIIRYIYWLENEEASDFMMDSLTTGHAFAI